MVKRLLLTSFIFITGYSALQGSEGSERSVDNITHYFKVANQYYENQSYLSALEVYQKIIDQAQTASPTSLADTQLADVYYNLGTTYYKLYETGHHTNGFIAKTIVSFKRALLLNPAHDYATHNLLAVESQIDFQEETKISKIESIYFYLIERRNFLAHLIGFWLLIILTGSLLLYLKILSQKSRVKKYLIKLLLLGGLGYILTLGLISLLHPALIKKSDQAVIKNDLELKAEPSRKIANETVLKLHEGSVVTIIRSSMDNQWVEAEKKNFRGWVERKNLILIEETR